MPKYQVKIKREYVAVKQIDTEIEAPNQDEAWTRVINSSAWENAPVIIGNGEYLSDESNTIKLDNQPERCSYCEYELKENSRGLLYCPACRAERNDLIDDQALDSDPHDVDKPQI